MMGVISPQVRILHLMILVDHGVSSWVVGPALTPRSPGLIRLNLVLNVSHRSTLETGHPLMSAGTTWRLYRLDANVSAVSGGDASKRNPLTRDPRVCASDFGIFVQAVHGRSSYSGSVPVRLLQCHE